MNRTLSVILPVLLFASFGAGLVVAQHEPAVRICRKTCDSRGCFQAYGNGTIIGKSHGVIVVATAAHVVSHASEVKVQINNNWTVATVAHSDDQSDFATVMISSSVDVPVARVARDVPPVGTDVTVNGYWPEPWTFFARRRKLLNLRWLAGTVVQGVSGSGVEYNGELAGIVSAVNYDPNGIIPRNPHILIVPVSVINQKLKEWGYQIQDSPPIKEPEPPRLAINNPPRKESHAPSVEQPAQSTPTAPGGAVNQQSNPPEPEKRPIEKIKNVAIFGVKTYLALKYGSVLAAVSGAAGGIGWLIGRRIKRMNGGDLKSNASQERVVTIDTPPPKQVITPEVRYAPYAVDDFADAFAWAETQMARKYPGSIGTTETLKSMIDQYLSSKKKEA